MLHKDYEGKGSVAKEISLVVSLKEIDKPIGGKQSSHTSKL
jgi:hypothetical protein